MRSLEHTTDITESAAIATIFDGARGNAERCTIDLGTGYCVSFTRLASGNEHEAAVRDKAGVVVALAIVDEFDI